MSKQEPKKKESKSEVKSQASSEPRAKSLGLTSLEKTYRETVVPRMMKHYKYKSIMQVPRLVKCVVNMGVGGASEDIKLLEDASRDLGAITGQKPVYRRAKKSISNFKIRKGQPIGCTSTLRKKVMFEFLDRLMNIVLPRIRDFRGVNPRSFDSQGNYSLGLQEQTIFPEIRTEKVTKTQGMDITIVTTATNKEEALALLYLLGMPFRGKDERLHLADFN